MSVIVTVTMFYIVTATEERMSDNVLIIISEYLRRGRESRDEEGGRLGPRGSTGLGEESFNF